MSQSLANILVHTVFSSKNRAPVLSESMRGELQAYIGGIIKNLHGNLLKAGSVEEHIHLLIAHPRICSPADLVKEIKTGSSKWIKAQHTDFRDFHWQGGYGMFSISPTHIPAIEYYIGNQVEHHRQVSFQDEFRQLLKKYNLQWDERYIWD